MKPHPLRRRRIPLRLARPKTHLPKLSLEDATLVAGLHHPRYDLRDAALRAVLASGRADLAPSLFPLLSNRRCSVLQSDAAVALGNLLSGTGHVPRPLKRLLRDPYWVTRIDALEAVDEIGDYRVLPLLTRALYDKHPIVRSYAASILGHTTWQHFVPRLRKVLARERDERAKVGLFQGLILLGDTRLLDPLLELLKSPDYTMRCTVLHSLEALELSAEDLSRVVSVLEKLGEREPTRAVRSTLDDVLRKLRTTDQLPASSC
jgi:HEAT repeat protein